MRHKRATRQVILLTGLLAAVFAVLAAPEYRFSGDTAQYVGLARAIADGDPYEINGRPETNFPPGFPLVLAPAAWAFDGSFAAISRWAAALASLAFLLTWLYVRRREPGWALPIATLTVCSVPFLLLATDNPMSEPLFLVLTLVLLLWADREESPDPPRAWSWTLLGGAALVAVPAFRIVGVVAVAACALWIGTSRTSRRWRNALPLGAAILFVVGWLGWGRVSYEPWFQEVRGDYLYYLTLADPHHPDLGRASLLQLLGRPARNLAVQAAHVGELITPVIWFKPSWFSPILLTIPVIATGWWRELHQGSRFAALYFLCYTGVILLWPFDEGPRFMLPLLPLLWIYLAGGARQALQAIRTDRRGVRLACGVWSIAVIVGLAGAWRRGPDAFSRQDVAALLFAIVVLAGSTVGWRGLAHLVRTLDAGTGRRLLITGVGLFAAASIAQNAPAILARARSRQPDSENARALWEAARWITANTAAHSVIQATWAERLHFGTGRQVVVLPVTEAPEPFREIERRYHPDYLVVLDSEDPYLLPSDRSRFAVLARLFPDRWHLIHEFPGGRIYAAR